MENKGIPKVSGMCVSSQIRNQELNHLEIFCSLEVTD